MGHLVGPENGLDARLAEAPCSDAVSHCFLLVALSRTMGAREDTLAQATASRTRNSCRVGCGRTVAVHETRELQPAAAVGRHARLSGRHRGGTPDGRERLRSFQIAPLDPTKIETPLAPPWLSVNVACLGGGVAFRTDVDFIGRLDTDLVRLSLNSYGGLGMAEDGDGAYILAEIEQRVEAAVADFVVANSQPDAPAEAPRRSNRGR
jgi:hypothetical protein